MRRPLFSFREQKFFKAPSGKLKRGRRNPLHLRCPARSEEADDEESCMDLNGSCASPEGGICGRGDAAHGSFEAQKVAGSLHIHVEVNVACLHQHTPL